MFVLYGGRKLYPHTSRQYKLFFLRFSWSLRHSKYSEYRVLLEQSENALAVWYIIVQIRLFQVFLDHWVYMGRTKQKDVFEHAQNAKIQSYTAQALSFWTTLKRRLILVIAVRICPKTRFRLARCIFRITENNVHLQCLYFRPSHCVYVMCCVILFYWNCIVCWFYRLNINQSNRLSS